MTVPHANAEMADTGISTWPNKKETSANFYNRKLNNISKFVRCYLLRVNCCNSISIQFNYLSLIKFLSLRRYDTIKTCR